MRTTSKSKYKNHRPPLFQTDKHCLIALAGILTAVVLTYELTDGRAIQVAEAVEVDKPQVPVVTVTAPTIDYTPLLEAIEARRAELFWKGIPLDLECQEALRDACDANGVPVCLALGLIEVESGFDPDANSGVSRGLMQLNEHYFPADLTPAENIQAGVDYLGELLEQYDDEQAALRAYNKGWDDGDREYSRKVLTASEKYGRG